MAFAASPPIPLFSNYLSLTEFRSTRQQQISESGVLIFVLTMVGVIRISPYSLLRLYSEPVWAIQLQLRPYVLTIEFEQFKDEYMYVYTYNR
eukprot:m.226072 g.226072  ORF g.226072 m.226072 type:complete len:92 (+) comp33482_c2_seq1:2078-2353(+)